MRPKKAPASEISNFKLDISFMKIHTSSCLCKIALWRTRDEFCTRLGDLKNKQSTEREELHLLSRTL